MNQQRLLQHFAIISEGPDAVAKLRRFILDLAVRGKLVDHEAPQADREEVKAVAMKGNAEFSPVRPNEFDFSLPTTWKTARLGQVAECLDFMRRPINSAERLKRIEGKASNELFPYFGATQQQGFINDFIFNESLVLLGEDGVPFLDPLRQKAYLIEGKTWVNNHAHVFRVPVDSRQFLTHWLNVFNYSGRVAGATRSKLNQAKALDIPVPLPPIAEQHRIVAKVDELMALCDQLQVARDVREKQRGRLVAASLARLNEPKSRTFHGDARFALDAFPAFVTRSDEIKQLRQTLLNLAVRGRLVPQNQQDEPAIAFDKTIPVEIEAPFNIPKSWKWARIRTLGKLKGGGTPSKMREDFWGGLIPWASPKDMKVDHLTEAQMSITEAAVTGSAVNLITTGSIVFVVRGMILAHSFPVAVTRVPLTINQDMKALELRRPEMAEYLLRALKGLKPEMLARVQRSSHGTCRLEGADYNDFLVPIPPIAEQHRIVAKVDELMALCDQLEDSLAVARIDRSRLLDALLHEALQPAAAREDGRIRDKWRTRSAISSYVVSRLSSKRSFGRTAHMKHLYLAEAHMGLELDGAYAREAAGPLDARIYDLEKEATSSGWYSPRTEVLTSGQVKVTYSPGKHIEQIVEEGVSFLGSSRTELDRVLSLMGDLNTEEVEIIATLFAAWNDALIDAGSPDDDWIVKEVREHWHQSKQRFTPAELKKWLKWMRANDLAPAGKLPRTIQQVTLDF